MEIDQLKSVLRQTLLIDGSRRENSAEHSWHLCVMALILQEHTSLLRLDTLRVLKMLIIHDIIEIAVGDTLLYDTIGREKSAVTEAAAAASVFGILPDDQAAEYLSLWTEFEERSSAEARFAASLDRLQPIIHNYLTDGSVWVKHNVTVSAIINRNQHIHDGSPILWDLALSMILDIAQRGLIIDDRPKSDSKAQPAVPKHQD